MSSSYVAMVTYTNHLNVVELRASLGLLFLTETFKSNHEDVKSLFATDGTGSDIFRAVTNINRFLVLLAAVRFDNPVDQIERKLSDSAGSYCKYFLETY